MKPAIYFDELENSMLECLLCPHHCRIKPGDAGICGARINRNGMLYSLNYGELTSISMDPVEKKPFYHYRPGKSVLSVGSWGCNMKCPHCQNWGIATKRPRHIQLVKPTQLLRIIDSEDSWGVAFTYNEPTVFFEFILDTARVAAKTGIETLLVTNGYIESDPLELLIQSVSAMNIDLKGWNDDYYLKELGAKKEYVLKTIERAVEVGVHVEITTLIVTDKNDSLEELEEEFKWLSSLSKDIPLHLTRYYPAHKAEMPATNVKLMKEAHKIAKKYLNYVYLGNIPEMEEGNTYCPECGALLIRRKGYNIELEKLDEKGRCTECGKEIPIIL
ncbi:MAG: AmmeMemoRadiSam system radical SAM enzyme [Thermotogota bacterium]|nr:AmmeMemoRadiSam system radical SAM enzyme [Thermotogota bacterium]